MDTKEKFTLKEAFEVIAKHIKELVKDAEKTVKPKVEEKAK